MKLRFPESDIRQWAARYQYPRDDKETELLLQRPLVQQTGFINLDQLLMLARWKAPRSAGHVKKNTESFVRAVSEFALSTHDERAKIEAWTLLDGVLWPTASAILHLFHPDPYPILDFRALSSVGLKVPKQYTFEFWWHYVEFCRAVADRNGVDMRTLDRALWQYSKKPKATGWLMTTDPHPIR